MTDKFILTVTDITGKVTKSFPFEMDEHEQAHFGKVIGDIAHMSHLKIPVKEAGIEKSVYFNPRNVVSVSIEYVK